MGSKPVLAGVFDRIGLNSILLWMQAVFLRPYIRAVNYHEVSVRCAAAFEEQLAFYQENFEPVGKHDLLKFLRIGSWPYRRPGIILTFDDGLRSHAEVVAPLLEKYGFSGWFMVPVGFVDADEESQQKFAIDHDIQFEASDEPRIALSIDELRRLDKRHVVACHTRSHCRLSESVKCEAVTDETLGAKQRLEQLLGHEVTVFAWVGGEEHSYSAVAARALRDAGFQLSFMTNSAPIRTWTDPFHIQRSNVEASFSLALVRFVLSGFYDLMYLPKRWRVNTLTNFAGDAEPGVLRRDRTRGRS